MKAFLSHCIPHEQPLLFGRLFKKEPKTKILFGFPIDVDTDSAELLNSKRFLMHTSYLIEMLDTALQMLGPDIEVRAIGLMCEIENVLPSGCVYPVRLNFILFFANC